MEQGTALQGNGNQGNPAQKGREEGAGEVTAVLVGWDVGVAHGCPCSPPLTAAQPLQPPLLAHCCVLEQIVAGIVGYLNLHIIPSSVLH